MCYVVAIQHNECIKRVLQCRMLSSVSTYSSFVQTSFAGKPSTRLAAMTKVRDVERSEVYTYALLASFASSVKEFIIEASSPRLAQTEARCRSLNVA